MPRLLVISDGSVSLDGIAELPAPWRIVVLPAPDAVVGRVGQETSLALIAVRAEDRRGAARALRRHLPSVPCVAFGDETGEAMPAIPTRMRGSSLASALLRACDAGALPDEATRPGTTTAGSALLRRMRNTMVDGITRAGEALSPAPNAEGAVPARIDAALSALDVVRTLIDDLPALGTIDEISRALAEEVAETLDAHAVAVWRQREDVMEVVASEGLTAAEQRMTVGTDHPVVADLSRNVNGVLLSPLEEAQSLVAGIAGARGEALVAAALDVDGTTVGFVNAASSRGFDVEDLRRLEELAAEAARGLALATILAELGLEIGERENLVAATTGSHDG